MAHTIRKHPHGIDADANPTRDGHDWHGAKQRKFATRYANRKTRRDWLTDREARAVAVRMVF